MTSRWTYVRTNKKTNYTFKMPQKKIPYISMTAYWDEFDVYYYCKIITKKVWIDQATTS